MDISGRPQHTSEEHLAPETFHSESDPAVAGTVRPGANGQNEVDMYHDPGPG